VLSHANLLKFAAKSRTRAFRDRSTRKPSRSPYNYLNRFCELWRFRPFRLRVVCDLSLKLAPMKVACIGHTSDFLQKRQKMVELLVDAVHAPTVLESRME
jgi:hypothetical protein